MTNASSGSQKAHPCKVAMNADGATKGSLPSTSVVDESIVTVNYGAALEAPKNHVSGESLKGTSARPSITEMTYMQVTLRTYQGGTGQPQSPKDVSATGSRRGSADATIVENASSEQYALLHEILPSLGISSMRVTDTTDQKSLDQQSVASKSIDELTTYAAFGITLPSLARKRNNGGDKKALETTAQPPPATKVGEDPKSISASSSVGSNLSRRRWSLPAALVLPLETDMLSTPPLPTPPAGPSVAPKATNDAIHAVQIHPLLPLSPRRPVTPNAPISTPEQFMKKRHSTGSIRASEVLDDTAPRTSTQDITKKASNQPRSILRYAQRGPVPPSTNPDPRIIPDFGRPSSSPLGSGDSVDDTILSNSGTRRRSTNGEVLGELPEFEKRLKMKMTSGVYMKGEFIIRKHDIGKEMYFLSRGKVEVLSSDGKTQYSVIHSGSFFGASGLTCVFCSHCICQVFQSSGSSICL